MLFACGCEMLLYNINFSNVHAYILIFSTFFVFSFKFFHIRDNKGKGRRRSSTPKTAKGFVSWVSVGYYGNPRDQLISALVIKSNPDLYRLLFSLLSQSWRYQEILVKILTRYLLRRRCNFVVTYILVLLIRNIRHVTNYFLCNYVVNLVCNTKDAFLILIWKKSNSH